MSRSLDEESGLVPIGRPREFDTSKAIDSAMLLFWRKGYEGTSISDLTETLGITRPSLYAAFGNKEQLFRTVLDRYDEGTAEFLSGSLDLPTAHEVAEGLLRGAANFHANPANPPGCLMVHGALVGSDESDPLRRETRNRRARLREAIRERLERALAEGDLPARADPEALARYIVVVMRGMAVEAASGAKGRELHQIVDMAMRAWPASKKRARRR
jgi:AcrR family transcriptional regulator